MYLRKMSATKWLRYSGLMFFCRITSVQRWVSAWMVAARSAGFPVAASMPSAASFSLRAGVAKSLPVSACELVDDRARRAGRHHQRIPGHRLEARQALLGNGRCVGHDGRALEAGHAQRAQLAALDVRQHRRHLRKHHADLAAQQVIDRRAYAFVGHVQQLHAAIERHQLAGQVRLAAGARRGKADAAGLLRGQRQQLLDGAGRHGGVHHQHVFDRGQHGDGREV
jgi:hypothetical protein